MMSGQITSAAPINNDTQFEQERRRVSSVVLEESFMEPMPEDTVRYVEVPQVQEVLRYVPKKEIVEVEKRVPRYEVEYVDRIVDVPHVEYVDKHVEVPQYQELVKHVAIHQVVDVPKEIIKTVPKVQTRVVENVVEVPGDLVEVPKPYTVENKVTVPQYYDKHVPLVVAQTVRPVVTETHEEVEVEVMEYEPEIIQVEVQVPKPVPAQLIAEGVVEEVHRVITVPAAHFNSLMKALNPHISDPEMLNILPFERPDGGPVPFLPPNERVPYITPMPNAFIEGMPQEQPNLVPKPYDPQPYRAMPYGQEPYQPQPFNPEPFNPEPFNPEPFNPDPYNNMQPRGGSNNPSTVGSQKPRMPSGSHPSTQKPRQLSGPSLRGGPPYKPNRACC